MSKLSICIPSYNYGHYLGDAISSCLDNEADFKLVVLDNASRDNTDALRTVFCSDSRVEWHRNSETLGIQANWNKAVGLCKTPWVKMLQADDKLAPGGVNRLLEIIKERPLDQFHGFLCSVIDKNGKIIRRQSPYSHSLRPIHLEQGQGLPMKLKQQARLKEPTSNMFSRHAWESVGGYPDDLRFTFDIAFNVELMANYPGTLWSEYLGCVRRHPGSDGARLPAQLAIDDLVKLQGRILRRVTTKSARRDASAWLIYRMIELSGQRLRSRPRECIRLIRDNLRILVDLKGWAGAASMFKRKITTGDIQKILP